MIIVATTFVALVCPLAAQCEHINHLCTYELSSAGETDAPCLPSASCVWMLSTLVTNFFPPSVATVNDRRTSGMCEDAASYLYGCAGGGTQRGMQKELLWDHCARQPGGPLRCNEERVARSRDIFFYIFTHASSSKER